VRLLDRCPLQGWKKAMEQWAVKTKIVCIYPGSLQLYCPAKGSASLDDLQRLLRENGAASEIT